MSQKRDWYADRMEGSVLSFASARPLTTEACQVDGLVAFMYSSRRRDVNPIKGRQGARACARAIRGG
jgi:hypothetical protein